MTQPRIPLVELVAYFWMTRDVILASDIGEEEAYA